MLPLSEQLLFHSAMALFFAFYVAFFCMTSKSWGFVIPPIIVLCASVAYGIWRIMHTSDGYEGFGIAVLMAINFTILISGAIWVIVLRFSIRIVARVIFGKDQWEPRLVIFLLLAIAPALLTTLHAIERQRVPNSPCSTESVELILGTREYVVYPELAARIETRIPGREHRRVWHYSRESRKKENLHEICQISEGGSKPIAVDLLWLTPASIIKRAETFCADEIVLLDNFCGGISGANYQNVHTIQLTRYPDEFMSGLGSWLKHKDKPNLWTGGNLREGFVCHGTDETAEQITCTAWRPIDSEVTVFATSMGVRRTTKAEILDQVQKAVDFTLTVLTR